MRVFPMTPEERDALHAQMIKQFHARRQCTEEDRERIREEFLRDFQNYGALLDSMTPEELAQEIGRVFPNPKQCIMITVLMTRLEWLTRKVGVERE